MKTNKKTRSSIRLLRAWCRVLIAIMILAVLNSASAEMFGGIDFPGGVSSFADFVIQYDPAYSGGPVPTDPLYLNPNESVGPPDYIAPNGSVSLGRGGLIELAFADNTLTNSGDAALDLHVFEVGPDVEDTFVAIRPTPATAALLGPAFDADGDGFYEVGKVFGSTDSIDIDAFFPPFPMGTLSFDAVQLIDDPAEGGQGGATVGADIDSVGAIQSEPIECFPDLPDPELVYLGSEDYIGSDGEDYTRYLLSVDNWPVYPEILFGAAPDLPPCGLNTEASRTWVAIYQEDGTRIYGFCALSAPEQLTGLWFGLPKGATPPECVYITLTDRRCDIEYTSNLACIFLAVDVDIKPTSCPNPLNVKSKGVLPVAILGAEDLDVTTIDPLMITLAGVGPIRSALEDVATPLPADAEECECTTEGPDGFLDLTLKFDRQAIVEAIGPVDDGDMVILTLEGLTDDDFPVMGSDCVWILKKGKN